MQDIENLIFNKHYSNDEKKKYQHFLKLLIKEIENTDEEVNDSWYKEKYLYLRRKLKQSPSKSILSIIYQEAIKKGELKKNKILEKLIRNKSVRSNSGIL